MNTSDEQAEAPTLERKKLSLEVERLGLDVRHQRLKWFTKPTYLSVLVPVALAGFAFFAVLLSGWFDAEKSRLQIEVRHLQAQRNALQQSIHQIRQDSELKTYALEFDRSQVPQEILDALPATKDVRILTEEQLQKMAKDHGLLGSDDAAQIQWDPGDIGYWNGRKLPAWDITLYFLAHKTLRQKANELEIRITDKGDWSSWAGPIYIVLKGIAHRRWDGT